MRSRRWSTAVTEVVLLVVAVALVAACAVFVAAEFSLTTVENSAVERAAQAGERGRSTALKAVNRLTFQLSGAQLGITLTSLLIGMLAEPSAAALLARPAGRGRAVGRRRGDGSVGAGHRVVDGGVDGARRTGPEELGDLPAPCPWPRSSPARCTTSRPPSRR